MKPTPESLAQGKKDVRLRLRHYAVIVPLMISNLVSLLISSRLQKQPIYEALAMQVGIHLPTAESRQRSVERQVRRLMRAAPRAAASRANSPRADPLQ